MRSRRPPNALLRVCFLVSAVQGRFLSWTQTEPNVQPMELTGLPGLARKLASETNLSSYEAVIVGEEMPANCNETRTSNVTAGSEEEDEESSPYSPSLDALLANVDSTTLLGLQRELENKTGVGSRSSSVFFGASQTEQRVALLRWGSGDNAAEARKLGNIVSGLVESLPNTKKCALVVPRGITSLTDLSEITCAFMLGLHSDQRFRGTCDDEHKPDEDKDALPQLDLIMSDEDCAEHGAEELDKALRRGRVLAEAVSLCCDIVNAPHNVLNSCSLAATAMNIARQHRTLSCQVLDSRECERLGMGSFLGVARGSETQAQFIHLCYRPHQSRRSRGKGTPAHWRRLGIVGKGLLFDSGGYNIKTGRAGMTYMKMDCGGAAAALGAAHAIASLEPENVEVHFLIAACENMINEKAVVPGDILTASNGKTIEVLDTDAEGRLTMALVYADKTLHCEEIVELSTLTGTCIMALGSAVAGFWTHDEEMADTMTSVAKNSGEKVWRLPMEEEYAEDIKSKIADIKNIGGRFGGAITAALFLQHFVEEAKFTHVDMAGPVWDYKQNIATGWGVRFLNEWVHQRQGNTTPRHLDHKETNGKRRMTKTVRPATRASSGDAVFNTTCTGCRVAAF